MKIKPLIIAINLLFLSLFTACAQTKFDDFTARFVSGYSALKLPQLSLAYVDGFKQIKSRNSVQQQLAFFNRVKGELPEFKPATLSQSQKLDYELIKYETGLNLERIALELEWLRNKPDTISTGGIITVPNGKAWYAYLLKRWVNADVNPDEIYKFGLGEVERVKEHIEAIRLKTGLDKDGFYKKLNDSSFFYKDQKTVQRAFEHTQKVIYANLHNLFYENKIPALAIKQNSNSQMAQVPGFYNNNTFYYNIFGKPYNKRQVDWLFIHEGVPGHHYQNAIGTQDTVQQLFFYLGFAEGWAAYTEELGKELGVYKTPYDELGKWEWDIVRSVRVPLDIGLNYYGWTDGQALAFWKKNIVNQDDIAMREIKRMRRWPAQVITYKYGALQILGWKAELQKKQGDTFNIKDFHQRILAHSTLPLYVAKSYVFNGKL